MKNYEIKSAMAELSVKQKLKVNSGRIAFLVQDVFRKLKSGFSKKIVAISNAVNQAASDAVEVRDAYNANKIANINETVDRKEEKVAEIKTNANLSDADKNYIIKAYESDIEKLRNKTIKVANAPRRLLISTMFIQKLFANRKKKKAEKQAARVARAEEMLNGLPTIDEETPVVEKDVDSAIQRYIELNNERNNILDEKRAAQERLDLAEVKLTRCQDEMQRLVTEYGLTQEMVESRYTK